MEWSLSPAPSLVIGDAASPGHELFRVAGATRLRDGRLIVLNAGTNEIRSFSPSGALIRASGREGEGPGEYERLRAIRRDGSAGLWVYDSAAGRVTHLDENLAVLGTHRVGYDPSAGTPVRGPDRPFRDGSVPIALGTLTMWESFARRLGLGRDSVRLSLHRDGALVELARLYRGENFGVKVGTSGLRPPIPFGETLVYGSGPASFIVGTSHSTRFRVLDTRGRAMKSYEARGRARSVTSRDWDLFQEEFRAKRESGVRIRGVQFDQKPTVEEFLAETPRGDTFPMFDAATIDDAGRVWVREYSLGDPVRTWQILGMRKSWRS